MWRSNPHPEPRMSLVRPSSVTLRHVGRVLLALATLALPGCLVFTCRV